LVNADERQLVPGTEHGAPRTKHRAGTLALFTVPQ
jgi:hypothetical protein